MSASMAQPRRTDFYLVEEEHHEPGSSTHLGFWIYLMSDCLIFAVLFATYGVLGASLAGGPGPRDLFNLGIVGFNTTMLLISSITGVFGAIFVAVEIYEFAEFIHEGAGPQRSGFLSAFFALVGTHGLHVSFGLIWILIMASQVMVKGLTAPVTSRCLRLGLFWHFLDIV